ncbi:MAG: GNAT family N-acetyltransferase [Bacteroidota bacterium]|nr:GNAT family N-acetyltransferase [Bacteroidota bacterium]
MPQPPSDRSHVHIRPLRHEDADAFLALIDALADYEKLARPDADARTRLIRDAFANAPRYEAFLASVDGRDVGYAIIYETYSSFLALPTLYLEDIFVLPDARSNRVGLALFLHVAGLARARGCGRMDWTVLNWNTLAQDFYDKLGARHLEEWQLFRLDAASLKELPASGATTTD